jgi:hypothetical protein
MGFLSAGSTRYVGRVQFSSEIFTWAKTEFEIKSEKRK